VTFGDLVERNDLYYEKFTNVPFTGKVTGKEKGSIKNGKRDGVWIGYHENGQLWYKQNYKNDEKDGAWVSYFDNGSLEYKGNYKNGKIDGAWVRYWTNGQLMFKVNFKNGEREGASVRYYGDGTVDKGNTGTFKNGVKISD